MAKRINYTDKTAIQNDETIKEENKVTDGNMNEIKKVVNENADELEEKQNKEIGKGLSTNDFTNEYKQKLDELENYDDTLVKQDIEKIKNKNETQDKDIENLQQKNIQLQTELEQTKTNLENYAIHGKSTGEYIHLTDSSETDCRVDVRGNSKQATREGYNELENTLTDKTVEGITVKVNKDKSVTLNGTAKADINLFLIGDEGAKTLVLTLKKSVSYKNISGIDLIYRKINGDYGRINNNQIFTPAEDILIGSVYIQIKSGTTLNNTYYLLLVQGTEDKPYEQYGASPSLDYPSKIETVKGSVKVTSSSANTLDLTKISITEKPNVEIDSISANEVTFHTTNNTASSYYLRFKTILKKGTYYARKLYNLINGTAVTGNNGSGVIFISKSDWSKEFIRLYNNVEKGSFSLQEDTEVYITLMLGKVENGKIRFYNLMLANSDVNYVQNKEDSVVLPIQEEMLEGDYLDKVNKKEIHGWEKKVLNGTEKWINTGNTKTEKTLHLGIGYANSELLSAKINCKCENLKVYTADYLWNNEVEGIAQSKSQIIIRISKEKATNAEELKTFLAKNNITVYCKLVKRELPCTQEQIQALEKLNKLKTYKNITNITTDSIAILDVDYKKDLETLLNQITKESEA